ncbi:MAG: DNA adenine methylase, partial [Rivularia sp. ALOHA_DT_140]|nr:DNA adenine methylase [Rivularia sp. ALOHA_DT_140]
MINNANYSPFRYPGGKFYARKLIIPLIPKHTTYGECFLGGGQIFFCKSPSPVSFLNDLDPDLIATYRVIKDSPMELIRALQDETVSRERHSFYKQQKPTNELSRAIRWFYLNRTSYSGIMAESSCYL